MIEIIDKSQCCGCTACASICPQKAISMVQDEEGFLYPIIDKTKCINCGLCDKVCPVKNARKETFKQDAYIVNNKDEIIRSDSTSGGAFTPIAEYVLNRNGVVFGATFDDEYNVIHTYVEDLEEIKRFRGSKYVQSYLGDTFKTVKKFLDSGKMVCFSGTPCQIEGLKAYLQKDYENLVTVDVMCHAVLSPLVWKKYLKYEISKLKGTQIEKILFRDKDKYGYKYSTMTIKTNIDEYSKGIESDPYLRAFFGDLSDRPSCYDCKFKKQCHISDFTIWDCFIVDNFDKSLDDDKGTSRILVNTENGRRIFEEIKDNFKCTEVEVEAIVENVREMLHSVKINPDRNVFFKELNELDEKQFFESWFPDSIKVKIERVFRVTMAKIGIYKLVKKYLKKLLGK